MTTYSHKKSIRTVTDEQFSDDTTIDGTRIDKALQDLVDRFNAIPRGDISTRFVQKQFVFGYQPFEYKLSKTLAKDRASTTFRRSCTRFPWTFIANNENTTLDPQPGAPAPLPDDYEYKAEDYSNGFRYKGTYMDSLHVDTTAAASDTDTLRRLTLNKGHWYEGFWMRWWLRADTSPHLGADGGTGTQKLLNANGSTRANHPNGTTAPELSLTHDNSSGDQKIGCMAVRNTYQFAWSNSWAFEDAAIVDDLMVHLRTDSTRYTASFRDELINADASIATGSDDINQFGDADQLIVQLSVDSPFDRTDRRLNSVIVMQHQVNLRDIDYTPLDLVAANVADMKPVISTDADRMLNGPIIRLRDLNIPVPPGSNLRLAVIVPWLAKRSSAAATVLEDPCGNWPFVNSKSLSMSVAATAADPTVITTSTPHGLTVGDKVTFANFGGADAADLNGLRTVSAVTSATVFSPDVNLSGKTVTTPAAASAEIVSLEHGFNHQMGWSTEKAEPMIDWAPTGCLTVLQEIKK